MEKRVEDKLNKVFLNFFAKYLMNLEKSLKNMPKIAEIILIKFPFKTHFLADSGVLDY